MVVAQVAHVRNNTLSTFRVKGGDPFYTPCVDGKPCVDGLVEVTPGFDQTAAGIVVPWESSFRSASLEITEVESGQVLHCVVGPVDSDGEAARDWLQFRTSLWEPCMSEKWIPLGRQHILGLVGGSVEIQLDFRDARPQSTEIKASLAEVVHVELATKCVPHGTVFLNIFDLASGFTIPNAMLNNTLFSTIGGFHAAVEVYGEEWSFYRTPNPAACGVCKSLRPRHNPVHVYRQSLNLGLTPLKDWEVRYLIRGKLAKMWPGGGYDILRRNCIHFSDELLLCLGVQQVPGWVRCGHETLGSFLRVPWPISLLFSSPGEWGRPQRERSRRRPSINQPKLDGQQQRPDEQSDGEDQINDDETSSVVDSAPATYASTDRLDANRMDPGQAPADGFFITPLEGDYDMHQGRSKLTPRRESGTRASRRQS